MRLIGKLIAMGEEKFPSVNLGKKSLAMNNHATLLFEIIFTPKVVVAGKEMHLHPTVCKFGYFTQETGKTFWHGISILVPEVEHIAKHINCGSVALYLVKE